MLEPESCPDPEKDYKNPRLEVVQVLQSQEEAHVTAYQCLIKRTIRVTRCGFTSITYGSHIVEWRNTLAITREDCKNLVNTRQIELGRKGEKRMLTIRDSGSLTSTVFTKGNLDRDGNCQHANFVSGGRHYSKAYEQTTYEITAKTIMLDHKVGEAAGVKEAKYAGLVLRYSEDVCGCRCHATQIASLIVCFIKDNQTIGEVKWQTDFPVHLIAQQTQLGYTHLATNL